MKGLGVNFNSKSLKGFNGKLVTVSFFEHECDGETLQCVVDIEDMSEWVMGEQIVDENH